MKNGGCELHANGGVCLIPNYMAFYGTMGSFFFFFLFDIPSFAFFLLRPLFLLS